MAAVDIYCSFVNYIMETIATTLKHIIYGCKCVLYIVNGNRIHVTLQWVRIICYSYMISIIHLNIKWFTC